MNEMDETLRRFRRAQKRWEWFFRGLLFVIILTLVFLSTKLFGGEMRIVKNKYEADVILFVTTYPYEAHLYATVTDIGSYARQYDHYFKFVKYQNQSVVRVYFTKYKYEADVIVYYSKYGLGWKKSNSFKGRLH